MSESDLHKFIRQHKLAVLGSWGKCRPETALVGIAVTPELEIVFNTVKSSRKYKNLCSNPACSFVVGWAGEQTLQYEGNAEELQATNLERYQQIYFATWPDGRDHMKWPDLVYFAVRPTWIRFSDYDQSPPAIHEFTF